MSGTDIIRTAPMSDEAIGLMRSAFKLTPEVESISWDAIVAIVRAVESCQGITADQPPASQAD